MTWLKASLDSYGGLKAVPDINNIVKAQKTMTDSEAHNVLHPVSKNFSFQSRGLRLRKAYDVGPCKRFTPAHVCMRNGFGRPQGYRLELNPITARETATFRSRIL